VAVVALACLTVAAAACTTPSGGGGKGGGTATPITITASSATIAYGDPVPAITPHYTGLPAGQTQTTTPPNCGTTATSTSPPGTYATMCAGADQGSTTINYVNGSITITRAPVNVTASSASIGLGEDPPTITASYTGLKNGDTAPAVLPLCSTTATSSSTTGSYPSSCSGASDTNYDFTYTDGVVAVGKGLVTVTASSPEMTYGSDAPEITPTYAGFVHGETGPATAPTCSTTADSSSPAGTYASTCSGADDPSYAFVYVDGTVTVDPAPAVVTASSTSVHFHQDIPDVTASYSGLVNGDTAPATPATCSTDATSTSDVGDYTSTCSGAADPNYTFTYLDGTITITLGTVPVTVTAASVSMTYGGSVPDIAPSYSGFDAGQTNPETEATCTTDATSSSPAGTYTTTCSGADDPNYSFVYVTGTLTVLPAGAVVQASSPSTTYGTIATVTPSYSGLVNGDSAPATAPTCSTTQLVTSGAGTSFPSTCSGAADPNYTFTYTNGTVTVTKAPVVVTASNATMVYNATVPTITPSYSGLKNGATQTTTKPTCNTVATRTSPVGTYASNCSGGSDANYTLSFVSGTVTVTPKAATITASSPTTTYGTAAAAVTFTTSGLVNSDTLDTAPTCTTTYAGVTTPVGQYPTTCSGAADINYTFSYVAGKVTVNTTAVNIAPTSTGMTQGDTPAITPVYTGLKNGETSTATPATCSTTADSTSGPGTYPATCSGAVDPNYAITYTAGTFRVHPTSPLPLVISAPNGNVDPGAGPTYSGLIPGDTTTATPPTCTTITVGQYATTCSGASDPDYTISYVDGSVNVHPIDGYAEYDPTSVSTTLTASANLASVTQLAVAGTTGFTSYSNLTIQSPAGAQAYFCKTMNATTMTVCSSNGATGTAPVGAYVTAAPMSRFDAYSVSGGKANVSPSSLTILSDVPAGDSGIPSAVTATAANGVITYVQSATPTGTFDLTYGICAAGTSTYSAGDPHCATGVIHYVPGVTSNIGADVTVLGITNHTYQNIDTAVSGPATVNAGDVFKVDVAPAPGAIPKLQPSSAGDATVNSSSAFTSVYPIPAGFTVQSLRLIGGDATSSSGGTNPFTATLCTTFATGACSAHAPSGNFINNSQPYVIVTMPTGNVVGGRQMTSPTLELTLQATGASGSTQNFGLTEVVNVTSATLIIGTTATFDGYPTIVPNTSTPPVGTPVVLKSIGIN
jgi:hypothetical protein